MYVQPKRRFVAHRMRGRPLGDVINFPALYTDISNWNDQRAKAAANYSLSNDVWGAALDFSNFLTNAATGNLTSSQKVQLQADQNAQLTAAAQGDPVLAAQLIAQNNQTQSALADMIPTTSPSTIALWVLGASVVVGYFVAKI